MTPFEAYSLYVSLKAHFTSENYDFLKYNGKSNLKYSNFSKRKDKYFFEKLSKHPDPKGFLLSSFVETPEFWIGTLFQDNMAEKNYISWKKRTQSFEYNFKSQLSTIEKTHFSCENGDHPEILKAYLKKDVDIETLVVLIDVLRCFSYMDKHLKNDFLWKNVRLTIKKYVSFISYDKKKIKDMVRQHFLG